MAKKTELAETMTQSEFDNGYWYATELRAFATKVGIPSANKLRKDELERALKHFLRTGESKNFTKRGLSKSGARDVDKGLRNERLHRARSGQAAAGVQASLRDPLLAEPLAGGPDQ